MAFYSYIHWSPSLFLYSSFIHLLVALGTRVEQGSEDEVVEVCEDDEAAQYGVPQFTDADLPTRTDSPQTHTDTQTLPSTSIDTRHTPTSSPQTHPFTDTLQTHTDTRPSTSTDPSFADAIQTTENEQPRMKTDEADNGIENSMTRDRITGSFNGTSGRSNSGASGGDGAVVEALRARVRELETACVRPHHSTCRVCHVSRRELRGKWGVRDESWGMRGL